MSQESGAQGGATVSQNLPELDELQPDAEENLREFIDKLVAQGYTVADGDSADPQLIDPGGRAVETWREDYPYDELLDRDEYEHEKYLLQIELLKLQYWGQDHGMRHIIVFEGRDAAGKGGTIKRFTEHLNPRAARVVALTKPTDTRTRPVVLPALRRSTSRPRARSCCSTGPGTTGPGSSG